MTDASADEIRCHDLHALAIALGNMHAHGLISEKTMSLLLNAARRESNDTIMRSRLSATTPETSETPPTPVGGGGVHVIGR